MKAPKQIAIHGVCSMKNCTGAPIAAMAVQISGRDRERSMVWVSQCLRHSKGHGKLDMSKVTQGVKISGSR